MCNSFNHEKNIIYTINMFKDYLNFNISTIVYILLTLNFQILDNLIFFILYFAYLNGVNLSNISFIYTSSGMLDSLTLYIGIVILRKLGYMFGILISYFIFSIGFFMLYYFLTPVTNSNVLYLTVYFYILCGIYFKMNLTLQSLTKKNMKITIIDDNKIKIGLTQINISYGIFLISIPYYLMNIFETNVGFMYLSLFLIISINTILIILIDAKKKIFSVNDELQFKEYVVISRHTNESAIKAAQFLGATPLSGKVLEIMGVNNVADLAQPFVKRTLFEEIKYITNNTVYLLLVISKSILIASSYTVGLYVTMFLKYLDKNIDNNLVLLNEMLFGIMPIFASCLLMILFKKRIVLKLILQLTLIIIGLVLLANCTKEYVYYGLVYTALHNFFMEGNKYIFNILTFKYVAPEDIQILEFISELCYNIFLLILSTFLSYFFQYFEFRYMWYIIVFFLTTVIFLMIKIYFLTKKTRTKEINTNKVSDVNTA